MTKSEREEREYKSLFSDERYAKKAWRQLIGQSLEGSGKKFQIMVDPKTQEQTLQSRVDEMAYNNVCERLKLEGKDRQPMQAELIVESNIIRARFTDTVFNTILDRTAGKVKDEIYVNAGQFEELSDEELALLAEYRENKESENSDDNSGKSS